ncbi:hypothetical protein [Sodalis sp.]|uniref:hypothetical protein n=1 Tax=Sodalis sp. (in: enterobacteria) TaxID=1898979 RepID=UPI00387396BF
MVARSYLVQQQRRRSIRFSQHVGPSAFLSILMGFIQLCKGREFPHPKEALEAGVIIVQ